MSLDQSMQQTSEHLTNSETLDSIAKQVFEVKKPLEKDYSTYPDYPAFDENELEEKAREFETVFRTRRKSEALAFFNELPAHCKKYIIQTKPYQLYWKASRTAC